jgi:hypothetical protein
VHASIKLNDVHGGLMLSNLMQRDTAIAIPSASVFSFQASAHDRAFFAVPRSELRAAEGPRARSSALIN